MSYSCSLATIAQGMGDTVVVTGDTAASPSTWDEFVRIEADFDAMNNEGAVTYSHVDVTCSTTRPGASTASTRARC